MREIFRYGFTLGLICVISSMLLAGANSLTKVKIIRQAQAEEEAGLKAVLPQAENFTQVKKEDEVLYYKAFDLAGKQIGVVFKASGKGYSSTIEAMVGMLNDGTINAIKVIAQNETPGLGAKIIEPEFCMQFSNKKDLTDIQAIAGATISSKAIIDSVRDKAEEIKELMKNAR